MILLQEAIIVVIVGVAIYYASDYSAHHRSYELFQTSASAGAHQAAGCAAEAHPRHKQYFDLSGTQGDLQALLADENALPGECFFAQGFEDSRETFRELARQAQAEELFDLDPVPVSDEPGLASSVAVLRGDPHKFLVHISGTHGVEAYAGTSAQFGILQFLRALREKRASSDSPQTNDLPTVVLVHALNPYGFKHSRRVNEHNVDLNRNFLSPEQWAFVRDRDPNFGGYVDVHDVLNPTTRPFRSLALNELHSLFTTARAALTFGVAKLKRAMVSGNYHFPQGYGYGGVEPAQSNRNLVSLLVDRLQIPLKANALAVVDVHTGLGPFGVDTLFFAESESFSEKDMERIFPSEKDVQNQDLIVGALKASSLGGNTVRKNNSDTAANAMHRSRAKAEAESVASGYELTIGTTESFCVRDLAPHIKDDRRLCVGQEFGTVPVMMVGKYAVDENYAHFHGTEKEKKYYGAKLLDCFYVQTNEWRRKVFYRGMKVFLQAFAHLSSLKL